MEVQAFYNTVDSSVQKYTFLGRDLYHFARACPGHEINQDSSAIIHISQEMGLLVVADGMGGMEKGEKISKLAIETLVQQLKDTRNRESKISHIILDALEDAHQKIKESKIQGGTTLSICEVTSDYIRFYNIGDSFGLLSGSRGLVKYRTIDDSITGYGVESGLITEEKALTHEHSNIITNALGLDDFRVEVSCKLFPSRYDLILMSSDGLSANLTTDSIVATITSGPYENKLDSVVQLATKQMTTESAKYHNPDDLSCFLFSYPGTGDNFFQQSTQTES